MTPDAPPRSHALAALAVGVLAMMVTGLQPLLLSGLADAGRVSRDMILPAAIVELLSMATSVAVCALLLRPLQLPARAAAAAAVCVLAGLAPLIIAGPAILAVRAVGGLAGGVLIWITVGMIARQARPEPWAAAFFLLQSAGQVFAAAIVSGWGFREGVLLGAGLSALGLLVSPLLGAQMIDLAISERRGPDRRGVLGLAALFLYFGANAALWFQMRPLAGALGLGAISGLVVLATLAAQMVGAMAALALVGKLGGRRLFGLVVALLMAACTALALHPPAPLFVAAYGLLAFAALLLGASLFAFLHEADPSRRAGAISPVAQFLAATFGPMAGLALARVAPPSAVLALAPLLALAGLACAWLSLPKRRPPTSSSPSPWRGSRRRASRSRRGP